MKMEQLPDGSWATSPAYLGVQMGHPCEGEHVWEESGAESPVGEDWDAPEGVTQVVIQVCAACKYQRFIFKK